MPTSANPQGEVPEQVRSAVDGLWRASYRSERIAFSSARFQLLERNCWAIYSKLPSTRLSSQSDNDNIRRAHEEALKRFFRWIGAPWYEGACPDASAAAEKLHATYLITKVVRTYFVPLDRLELTDISKKSPGNEIRKAGFGVSEIAFLNRTDLLEIIPIDALDRFEEWFRFPVDRLSGFYWLIVKDVEQAGAPWKRSGWSILDMTWDDVGTWRTHEPAYPDPVESALFVVLLCLKRDPANDLWEPFRVPWTYALTNDPFSEPPRAPDPSALTWTLIGDEHNEFEVPERSEWFDVDTIVLQYQLEKRWRQLTSMLSCVGTDNANFNPLTRHFFVKGFVDEGVDQLIANLCCLEATLLMGKEGRGRLQNRVARLLSDRKANKALNDMLNTRDILLHPGRAETRTLSYSDLAKSRWVTHEVVEAYLDLTDKYQPLDRVALLEGLSSGQLPRPQVVDCD